MDRDFIERALRLARGGYTDGGDIQSNSMPVYSDGQVNWGDSDSAADFARADAALRAMRSAPAPAPAPAPAAEPQAAPRLEPRRPPPVYSAPRDVPLPPVRPANIGQPVFQNSIPEGPGAYIPGDGFPARPPGQQGDPASLDPDMMAKGFTSPMSPPQPAPVPSVSMGYSDVSPFLGASDLKAPSFGAMENITPGAPEWPRAPSRPAEGKFTNRVMPLTPPAQPDPTTEELLSVLSPTQRAAAQQPPTPPEPTTDELLALLQGPAKSAASVAIDRAAPQTRAVPNMTPQQRDLIIRTIAAEASGKSPEEAQAIGHVIMNRIASGRYGKTPEKVLFAPDQFEPWGDPRGSNYPMRHKPGTAKYEKAQAALDAALAKDDITGGATLFWAPKAQAALGRPAPKWGRTGGLDIGETRSHREDGGAVHREHHADGDPVGDDQEYPNGARPLTIYRGVAPSVEPGPVDAPMQYPQAVAPNDSYIGPMDASVWGRSPTERVPLFARMSAPESALEQAAYKTRGEQFTSALGIEDFPKGQTYASQGPTGVERALQVIPNPANYLKRQGEAARENFDMMKQGVADIRGGNYAAGALGLGGGAMGYALSPITGAERVLFRDPYLNATGNLRDAEAVEMVADTALTGGLRGPAKMLLGKKSMEQLAAEPWRKMRMPPPAATAVGAGVAGMTLAPDEAEAGKLQKVLQSMRAYHGSPYKFDRFDIGKIGTGEGAQAYGHGLYFAEAEPVARGYRDDLSSGTYMTPKGEIFDPAKSLEHLNVRVASQRNLDNAIERAFGLLQTQPENKELISRDLRRLMDAKEAGAVPTVGSMYDVNINANPEHLLNWNKVLEEQPENVIKSLQDRGIINMGENIGPTSAGTIRPLGWSQNIGRMLGEKLYRNLIENKMEGFNRKGAEALASRELEASGIPGIKYLDAGSRPEGRGTHNYVIFNDKLIDINRRYAEGGGVEDDADGGSVVDRALMLLSKQGR